MESQWNATFYGKIELKFQNIFQVTVTELQLHAGLSL